MAGVRYGDDIAAAAPYGDDITVRYGEGVALVPFGRCCRPLKG